MDVSAEKLEAFGHRTEDLSGQCVKAAEHVESCLAIGASDVGAIFLPVMSQVEQMRESLVSNIDSIRRLTEASAQNLVDAAQSYRLQEAENAGQLGSVGGVLP